MFFNLSFLVCTLEQNKMRLSNSYTEVSLTHEEPEKLLELMEAIQNSKTMIGPMNLYPKKFVYLDTLKSQSSKG